MMREAHSGRDQAMKQHGVERRAEGTQGRRKSERRLRLGKLGQGGKRLEGVRSGGLGRSEWRLWVFRVEVVGSHQTTTPRTNAAGRRSGMLSMVSCLNLWANCSQRRVTGQGWDSQSHEHWYR